ncbi:hypothetical protein BB559_002834 [Furculomyces boomerangus]|uniref:Uncharacterized protein n=1 Tax=Furculomyces boomerangus TaxID=61424 RepID=A0A2T9YRX8_9FUNG|nr:hypothetical protein BB559_002834 [Furculomyces boomerangus]
MPNPNGIENSSSQRGSNPSTKIENHKKEKMRLKQLVTIKSGIKPQQASVFSTMPDSKGSINSSKLLDTVPEKDRKKTMKKRTGSRCAGITLDIKNNSISVTETAPSASKRVEKDKLKLQTPFFAPYYKLFFDS